MPKLKTNRGAAKRFSFSPSGRIKRSQAFKRHILTKKTSKLKRSLRSVAYVCKSDVSSVRAMMPYS
ncbi:MULTISPECIES: 50S ribosomal protein L35 [Candidatus Ichthyocystis]|uniref:50S ribosomal protein L35 n=1 Tax=Candidatus Ichthyocystis TaxID=2929841 RepID=UPI000AD9AB14|nr:MULTISPECIES: 50S ribosomal protein L35 [Ichthyocystis]